MSGERIRRLTVEPMSEASFALYGELFDSQQRPADSRLIVETGFEGEGRITASVIWQPSGGRRFTRLERHYAVTQAFIQLSGSPAVVCAAAPTNLDDPASVPRPEDVRAFLIDPAIGYAFHRGTWHSLDRYLLGVPGATFLILNVDPNSTLR